MNEDLLKENQEKLILLISKIGGIANAIYILEKESYGFNFNQRSLENIINGEKQLGMLVTAIFVLTFCVRYKLKC